MKEFNIKLKPKKVIGYFCNLDFFAVPYEEACYLAVTDGNETIRFIPKSEIENWDELNLPTEPDWSLAPEWAEWFAIDGDNTKWWFGTEPVLRGTAKFWRNTSDLYQEYNQPILCHDWTKSLKKRHK